MNHKRVIVGILIITLGVFLLLNNLGLVDFSVLWKLTELWPLLLIAIGFSIIFKERTKALYITWIIFIIIIILYGVYLQNNYPLTDMRGEDFRVEMKKPQETQYGNLDLNLGAAKLTIDKEDNNLLISKINGRPLDYKEEYEDNNRLAKISFEGRNLKWDYFGGNKASYYDFYLNKDVLWDLDLDLGAISGEINLADIPVKYIDLDFGAGDLDILLGDRSSELKFKIDTGASSLNIVIPEEAGIKVKIDSAFSNTNVNELGLIREGDNYISYDYENADVKIEFDIDLGAGEILFNRQ